MAVVPFFCNIHKNLRCQKSTSNLRKIPYKYIDMICIWITVTGCSPLTVVWTASPHFDKQSTIDQIQEKVDQTYTLLTHSAMCQKKLQDYMSV